MKKIVFFLFLYTSIFLLGLFLVGSLFFDTPDYQHIQETYIEKSNSLEENEDFNTPLTPEEKETYKRLVLEQKKKTQELIVAQETHKHEDIEIETPEKKEDELKYLISFFPLELEKKVEEEKSLLDRFLLSESVETKLGFLTIELYEKVNDVRGKFKDKAIKLFGVVSLPSSEILSVFIHEFGHYIDLYFLENTFSGDVSNDFYDISWESTKILKKGMKQGDFVSGYAMTNKYEDFAESFTYFVLHNGDFAQKAQKNKILKEKYDFFSRSVFSEKSFIGTNFSTESKVKNYYRDITKIPYDYKKFLQYLEKGLQ